MMLNKVLLSFFLLNLCVLSEGLANPYTQEALFPEDSIKFAGQPVDLDRFRPAFITENSDTGAMLVENILHEGKYWTLTLPSTQNIDTVTMQVARFGAVPGVTAAHVQLGFRALPEDGLFQLTRPGGERAELSNLVVSFEAARPEGESYNFFAGFEPNYLIVGRLASGEQRVEEYTDDVVTEQYPIKLQEGEATDLLLRAIQRSHDIGLDLFYDTLKPNCVTEAFGILDQTPSVAQNSPVPFLTILGTDPVAGPTIEALSERGVLLERQIDLDDEVLLSLEQLQNPSNLVYRGDGNAESSANNSVIARVEGAPHALVVVFNGDRLSEETKAAIQKDLYMLAPKVIEALVKSLSEHDSMGASSAVQAFTTLPPLIRELLNKYKDQEVDVSLFYAPWSGQTGERIDVMSHLDLDARLPIELYEVEATSASYNELHSGLGEALQIQPGDELQFALAGGVMRLQTEQEQPEFSLQILGRPKSLVQEVEISNEQVNISEVRVPDTLSSYEAPSALFSLNQQLDEELSPTLKVEFGGFAGVYAKDESHQAHFRIDKTSSPRHRARLTPYLKGSVSQRALSFIDVFLNIFSVDFDLRSMAVSDIDVRSTTGLFNRRIGIIRNATSDPAINQAFIDNINNQIGQQRENLLESSPGLSVLSLIASNGQSATTSPEAEQNLETQAPAMNCSGLLNR